MDKKSRKQGANAATKLLRVVDNVERILAIELFKEHGIGVRHPQNHHLY
jgi:histidine ammonia-lyase